MTSPNMQEARKGSLEKVLALILRSIYLKGHQDALSQTTDLSWEDKTIRQIKKVIGIK